MTVDPSLSHAVEALPESTQQSCQYDDAAFEVPDAGDETRRLTGDLARELTLLSSSAVAPPGLFRITKGLPDEALDARVRVLESLCQWYRSTPLSRRGEAEERIASEFNLPTARSELSATVDALIGTGEIRTECGAENLNLMLDRKVLKITRERHHHDFWSMLHLARNMHAAVRFLDGFRDPQSGLRIELCLDEMMFVRGEPGWQRILVQDFDRSTPIRDYSKEALARPPLREAWRRFLQRMQEMEGAYGVVLDLTDSKAGNHPSRGFIENTENVMVSSVGEETVLSVIDPDVFDENETHKFDPGAYLTPRVRDRLGLAESMKQSVLMTYINWTRKAFVQRWQRNSLRAELERLEAA